MDCLCDPKDDGGDCEAAVTVSSLNPEPIIKKEMNEPEAEVFTSSVRVALRNRVHDDASAVNLRKMNCIQRTGQDERHD
jgi:hypothetical protein